MTYTNDLVNSTVTYHCYTGHYFAGNQSIWDAICNDNEAWFSSLTVDACEREYSQYVCDPVPTCIIAVLYFIP